MQALVCFSDGAGRYDWLCRWLRPGFRHCWLAVNTEAGWILVDPRAHWLEIEWLARPDFDLAAFYRSEGVTTVAVEIEEPPKRGYPVFLFTCVEAVKRALGLRAWWCWTPYQLWRLLDGQHFLGAEAAEGGAASAAAGHYRSGRHGGRADPA